MEYDWKKLQELLDSGATVVAGMREDWGWTAETVTQENIDNKSIAGIGSSYWATPSMVVNDGVMEDCYIEGE